MFLGRFRAEARWLLESGAQRAAVRVYDYAEQPGQGAAIVLELADWAALHEMIEAELLPLLAGDGTAPASSASAAWSWGGRRKRRVAAITSIAAAAVVVIGGVAAAVTLQGNDHDQSSLAGSSPQAAITSPAPSVKAAASATTPGAAPRCTPTCATP